MTTMASPKPYASVSEESSDVQVLDSSEPLVTVSSSVPVSVSGESSVVRVLDSNEPLVTVSSSVPISSARVLDSIEPVVPTARVQVMDSDEPLVLPCVSSAVDEPVAGPSGVAAGSSGSLPAISEDEDEEDDDVNSSDHVCQAWWGLARRSSLGEAKNLGHRVCLRCGRSLASRVSHLLHTGSPREFRIYNVIQEWIIPRAIEVTSRICHACWVAADRAAAHMVSRPSTSSQASRMEEIPVQFLAVEETQPREQVLAADSSTEEVQPPPVQVRAVDLPVEVIQPPAQVIAADPPVEEVRRNQPEPTIVLPDYIRAIETERRCFIEGCQRTESTGIWPLNPDIFRIICTSPLKLQTYRWKSPQTATLMSSVESGQILTQPSQQGDDYIPATNTSQVAPAAALPRVQPRSTEMLPEENNATEITASIDPQPEVSPQAPTSNFQETVLTAATTNERPSSSALAVPIEVLSPAPKERFTSGQGKRKPKTRQSALVLTCTPNMLEIKSKNAPKAPPAKKKRIVSKTLFEDSSEEEDFPNVSQDDEDDCACIYCNDLYSRSKPGEDWLRCLQCSHWAHASCADVPKRTEINLQALLDHTASRLMQSQNIVFEDQNDVFEIFLINKWGFNDSSGLFDNNEFPNEEEKQRFMEHLEHKTKACAVKNAHKAEC
ncbi:hypothetical protein PYW07_006478 [Mythimna separata]|uniref:Zinc finger PHD-type domain-containing protein n=1 Tax=Mythimna separata TaxID=271217 RepID=A0AAD7YWD0_MYTSE|nr:hypothetical protein PYW07_006478 [Mythimna separata]